jgi:molecular chaperone DnaK
MAVVGIDLGTTYSVVATPQMFEGEFFERVGNVTIVKNERKLSLTPSVIGVSARGDLRVGHRAKALVGQKPEPIMFVKRFMGQEIEFHLGEETLHPEDVSAYILNHLKTVAENQMQEPIQQAVITVPAYFTALQKQLTKEAGEKAHLNVSLILQEPVAAALAYCQADTNDSLTIMTYDLGGGTFDVAIVHKQGGMFNIRSFAGDRQLGGHDFDRRLALWLLKSLNEQGYNLPVDPNHPDYHLILTRLMILAESIKMSLSNHEVVDIMEPVTRIVDLNGEEVAIEMEITRPTFEKLIADYIDETIRQCQIALEKADPPMTAKDLDKIVLVGGSSYIPMVSARLEAEFGLKPDLFEPELAVAIGAALQARLLDQQFGLFKLGYIPEVTAQSAIDIDGTLTPIPEYPDVSGLRVALRLPNGDMMQPMTGENGFVFVGLPLTANTANEFVLYAIDRKEASIAEYAFVVNHSDQAGANGLTVPGGTILAKPISYMTASARQVVIAPERTPLPSRCSFDAQTADQSGQVVVLLCEADSRIGEIIIPNVPRDLQIGTRVEVELYFRDDFFIEVRARIPSINREQEALIRMPPTVVENHDTLRRRYSRLRQSASEALQQTDKGKAFKMRAHLEENLEIARRELEDEPVPNLARAQETLDKVRSHITELTAQWQPVPPEELFHQQCQKIEHELIPTLRQRSPETFDASWAEQLVNIQRLGRQALADQADHLWSEANRQLGDLHEKLLSAIKRVEVPNQSPPDPQAIRFSLGMHLTQLRNEIQEKGWLNEFEAELKACETELHGIDATDKSSAMGKLMLYYQGKHEPLVNKVASKNASKSRPVGVQLDAPPLPSGVVEQLNKL